MMYSQIDKLADYIMRNIEGEPSHSEGAVDCAIHIIDDLLLANARLQADINHAVAEAKKYQPDYPWKDQTASEAVWALGQAFEGVKAANENLRELVVRSFNLLKETKAKIAPYTTNSIGDELIEDIQQVLTVRS